MDYTFFLGLFVAIPLSIFANLLTEPTQKWFESMSSKRAFVRSNRMLEEFCLVCELKDDHNKLTIYLMSKAAWAGRWLATSLLALGFLPLASSLAVFGEKGEGLASYLHIVVVVLFLVQLIVCSSQAQLYCRQITRMVYRIRYFSEYELALADEVIKLKKKAKR